MDNRAQGQNRRQGRLIAVVVTHNRAEQLRLTLDRLLASPPDILAAVVVIDNASSDGTGPLLESWTDPRLQVQRLDTNTGGAGGFARGTRFAMETLSPDWLVLMDDDGRPAPGALEQFHQLALDGWDAAAAAVYLPEGGICDMNRPGLNPFWRGDVFLRTVRRMGGRLAFHLSPEDYSPDGEVRDVDLASFVGFFVRADAVRRIGYPDASFFVYAEDGMYSLRLRQSGGRIGFFPDLRFEHDLTSFAAGSGRLTPLWKVYYYHRNLLILYRAASGRMFWPLLAVILPKWLWKSRLYSGERRHYLWLLARAVRHGLARRTGTDHGALVEEVVRAGLRDQ